MAGRTTVDGTNRGTDGGFAGIEVDATVDEEEVVPSETSKLPFVTEAVKIDARGPLP